MKYSLCSHCNGSGEGMADGTECWVCHGTGVDFSQGEEADDFDLAPPEDVFVTSFAGDFLIVDESEIPF